MKKAFKIFSILFFSFLPFFSYHVYSGDSHVEIDPLLRVIKQVERINNMRSQLASVFESQALPASKDTFLTVCKPVGVEMRKVAEQNGWTIVQMAKKYRNPAHKPDKEGLYVIDLMEDSKNLKGLWMISSLGKKKGIRYFRRVDVEFACLACHGEKERRPDFIKKNYPEDKAYNFKVGDLRGVYSVFIPFSD